MGGSPDGQGHDFSQLFGGGQVPGFPMPQNGVAFPDRTGEAPLGKGYEAPLGKGYEEFPEYGMAGGNMADPSLAVVPEEEPWDDQVVASTPTPEPGGGGRRRRGSRRSRRTQRRAERKVNRFFDQLEGGNGPPVKFWENPQFPGGRQ